MPHLDTGEADVYFEERGSGHPLLLLAPGGMRSGVDLWRNAAIDAWADFAGDFHLIAMDQRNTGRSRGPLDDADPWGMYARDQLAVLDHLGVGRFAAMGCCIGCSFVLKLAAVVPDRLVAGVLEQPIGVHAGNAGIFSELQRSWADELLEGRPEIDRAEVDRFLGRMWRDDFVVSVDRPEVAACGTPLLVLPGVDDYHPNATGHEIARMATAAEVLEPWKTDPERSAVAAVQVRQWLAARISAAG